MRILQVNTHQQIYSGTYIDLKFVNFFFVIVTKTKRKYELFLYNKKSVKLLKKITE